MDDPEAALMRVLYDEHGPALWRYAVRLTGDPARAEDVVQETLLRAWQHPEVTDGDRSARAWLFTVARNMIIDERRRRPVRSPPLWKDGRPGHATSKTHTLRPGSGRVFLFWFLRLNPAFH